ncbi:MAG TPA: NAD-dependent epimerase/dehydratase family protein [Ignavibacteriaceae bacterium]|nr:NAD-dependent epimerase/dehydratase family protein [Ignavibacteriaceae bacterium]
MKRILITGAHGFVGTNLSEYLANDHQLRLIALDIDKKAVSAYYKEYTWNEFSAIDFNTIDTIIHLAGIAHDTRHTKDKEEYFKINVGLTKRVFDQFVTSEAKKFIYFSSVKAVADSVAHNVLTEEDLPNPKTPYGQSKLEAEKYLSSQILTKEKSLYILRPAMIHGPGNKGNLNSLINLINRGLPYPLGAFSSQRSFTSIGNLNFVIDQFIHREIEPGIYQIADKESISINEIIKLIGEATSHHPRILNVPVPLVKCIAHIGNLLHLPLNSEKLQKLTENYLVSNKKLTTALGVDLPVQAHEGLKSTLNHIRLNKNNAHA